MPVGVFRKDEAGRYVFVNAEFCRLRGTTPEQFLGRTPGELGPLEDALTGNLAPPLRAELAMAQRNGLRLLRLVNSLLDFSRIEAGRTEATYELIDLPVLTADLASTFRATVERAGLRFNVETPPLPPVMSDPVRDVREPWPPIRSTVTRPVWERRPTLQDMARYYPKSAIQAVTEARVVLACRVTAKGVPENCIVDSEEPQGLGFGAASLKLARLYRMKPHEKDGQAVAGKEIRIPILWPKPNI